MLSELCILYQRHVCRKHHGLATPVLRFAIFGCRFRPLLVQQILEVAVVLFEQGSLYYQPKQCTLMREFPQISIHLHCLILPPNGCPLMTPDFNGIKNSMFPKNSKTPCEFAQFLAARYCPVFLFSCHLFYPYLVGGFNPFEKYYSNWKSSPNRGE